MVQKKIKSVELYNKYVTSRSSKTAAQQILEGQLNEYYDLQCQTISYVARIIQSLKKLQEIALLPDTHDSVVDYLDMMIQTEQIEKKSGYSDRIIHYKEIRRHHALIPEIILHGESVIPALDVPKIVKQMYKNKTCKAKSYLQAVLGLWR